MKAATLSAELGSSLVELAWEQWSQMGVSGASPREVERRAADPEALLLFTLEVARDDPRLFDEVLDWLVTNEQLISVQRLRNLCATEQDRRLVDAALAWVDGHRPRARLSGGLRATARADGEPLFRGAGASAKGADPVFGVHGFVRPVLSPSGKSLSPDFAAPINLAFRLRRLLGIGVRAEVVRALVTLRLPRVSGHVLTRDAGFAARNVREGLAQLRDAGVVDSVTLADERHYTTSPDRWAALLGCPADELPDHEDWIALLRSLVAISRWLRTPGLDDLSDYLRASQARSLIESVESDLRYAGVEVHGATAQGPDYWRAFEHTVRATARRARGM